MCGIFGWLGDPDPELARRLRDKMTHRGPDAAGEWFDPACGVWLGHRRLSIVDLSEAGAQPMVSASGRYVISFNGEVYNHHRLRPELEQRGARFHGHSDTEVMLAAIEHWGLREALARFIGMFAFALWDREQRQLVLARDRLGVKPLYYAHRGTRLAFASELRPLQGLDWVDRTQDEQALSAYFQRLYVPAPMSILRGVRKLEPGCVLTFDQGETRIERYWDVTQVAQQGLNSLSTHTRHEIAEQVDTLLRDAIALRRVADVPLGAFLSGGMDSSLVVSLMQQMASQPVKTYTIAFRESPAHNEGDYARAVAQHLGTDHTEFDLTGRDALDLVPRIAGYYDEPFADSSALPTYLVSELTRRQVTVALSGDGGDELFGGYQRHLWAMRCQQWRDQAGALAGPLGRTLLAVGGRRLKTLGGMLASPPPVLYNWSFNRWSCPPVNPWADYTTPTPLTAQPLAQHFMAADQLSYLPDDLLVKVDRASMAVSLEVREPLLDHRLVELAWRIPLAHKLDPVTHRGKLLLRDILGHYLPTHLIERPKMGFSIPVTDWLRGPLRPWAEDCLDPATLSADGVLNAGVVRGLWQEHLAGAERSQKLWSILMYTQWRKSL